MGAAFLVVGDKQLIHGPQRAVVHDDDGCYAGFMTATFAISVPSAIETFNWLATLGRGPVRPATPMLFALAFVFTFVIGGLSGVVLTPSALNAHLHDTYWVVAHIHYVLFGGSVFAAFAAAAYWFPKMSGRRLDEALGRVHFAATFLAFQAAFAPMHVLGLGGMGRRMYDPTAYAGTRHLQPYNVASSLGAWALGMAQLAWLVNVGLTLTGRRGPAARALAVVSAAAAAASLGPLAGWTAGQAGWTLGAARAASAAAAAALAGLAGWHVARRGFRAGAASDAKPNPWQATTLEWSAPSPPPRGNFAASPRAARGPDDYRGHSFMPQAAGPAD